ncbi:MAG: hypothetical protein N3G78_00450 [Desulfobacterota bacterium]|nr:hypothetical protein [Thermodesulfobacteriota bacterium]
MDVIVTKERPVEQEGDLLISGFFGDERPLKGTAGLLDWRLNGRLSRLLREGRLTGEWIERTLIPSQGRILPQWILLFGLGSVRAYSYFTVRRLAPTLIQTIGNLKASHICLSLPYGEAYEVDCGKLAEVLLEGFVDHLDRFPEDRPWMDQLSLSFGEGEDRFSELLFGVQTAKSILSHRLPIRLLTPSEPSL